MNHGADAVQRVRPLSKDRQELARDIVGAARRGWGASELAAIGHRRRDVLRRACELFDAELSSDDALHRVVRSRLRDALNLASR